MSSDRIRSLRVLEKLRLAEVDKARIQVAQSLQAEKIFILRSLRKRRILLKTQVLYMTIPQAKHRVASRH